MAAWREGEVRPLAVEALGERYRRYRLADAPAEEAMARSLRQYGQASPVVVCMRDGQAELLDGFKRRAAAALVPLRTLSVRVIEADEATAKAAIYGLNRVAGPPTVLEEAWIVHALVREDGLTQVQAAELLDHHKSWVNRRLALLERLCVEARDDLRLGLLAPSLARQLSRLPVGNQSAVLTAARREALTAAEARGVIDLLRGASVEQEAFILDKPRFLAFATHYGFKPWACLPRRAKTKGKVERRFDFVEKNLLNGRTFCNLAHLNDVTAWWLANVADIRVHRETGQRPIDRYADEQPHLIALPAHAYDTAPVVYRIANVDGFVCYQQNDYSVPLRCIGQSLPLRITEEEVIIYSPALAEIARHRLVARGTVGQRREDKSHRPRDDAQEQQTLLRERFAELGPSARRFLDGLLRDQRYGKSQARRVLALLGTYSGKDLLAALERAVAFGAYSAAAVERILAAQAQPKTVLQTLADDERRRVQPLLDHPVPPRSTAEYQHLGEDSDHGQAKQTPECGRPDERGAGPDPSAGSA